MKKTTMKKISHQTLIMRHLLCCYLLLLAGINHTYAQLSPGDIIFVGFVGDGNNQPGNGAANCEDGFAFAVLADIPANTTIYFTEGHYTGGMFTDTEGDVTWSNTEITPYGTIVRITTNAQTGDCTDVISTVGSAQFAVGSPDTWALGSSNEEIFAYLGSLRNPTVWLSAFISDNSGGANDIPAELMGFVIDFTLVDQDVDVAVLSNEVDCDSKPDCLAYITDLSNWNTENEPGSGDCCNGVGVEYPEDLPTSLQACDVPVINGVTITDCSQGPDGFVSYSVDGDLNGAEQWEWVRPASDGQSCADQTITQTGAQLNNVIFNNPTWTHYVRAVGGCLNEPVCYAFVPADLLTQNVAFPSNFPALCADAEVQANLGGASPAGGTYSGPGVTDDGNGMTFSFDPAQAGTGMHTITYTLNNECSSSATSTIEVIAVPSINIAATTAISCFGANDGTLEVQGEFGTPTYTLLWSNGASTVSQSNLSPGLYSVTVTNSAGCESISSFTLEEPAELEVAVSSTAESGPGNADGTATASASGGTSPYSYSWSNGQTGAQISGLESGEYMVTVTDANGCESTIAVVVDETVVVTLNSPPDYCFDAGLQTGLVGGSPSGGTYSGPGVVNDDYSQTYSFDPALAGVGVHTITYEFEGQTASVTVEVFALPVVSFTAPGPFNVDAGEQSLTGGMPEGGEYSGPGVLGLIFNPAAAGVGVHTITYTYTDENGCDASASGDITVEMMLPPDNECGGANDINTLFGQEPNVAQLSELWNNTGYNTTGDPTNGWDECFVDASLQHTIWYTFEGDGNTYLIRTVQCNATDYIDSGDTQAAIYSGDCAALTPVACNDDEDEPNQVYNISIELETVAGTTYQMMIDGWNGVEGEFCIEVTNLTTSSVTYIEESNIELFPNPTTGVLYLSNVDARFIEVYNNQGQLVFAKAQPGNSVDIAMMPAGLYFIKLYAGDEVYSAKIVKE
jgi:hypothetical protein